MTGRTLHTARLVLSPILLETAAALVAGAESGLRHGRGWPHEDTLSGLRMDLDAGRAEATGWFIALRETGEVIGDCGWRGGPDPDGSAEIGYGLAAPSRGLGYGTEAVTALVEWAVRQPGVRQLTADVLEHNVPSRRLLERIGFQVLDATAPYVRYALPVPARASPRTN